MKTFKTILPICIAIALSCNWGSFAFGAGSFNMKREIICGIYKITSPSGRIYVGKSEDVLRRLAFYEMAIKYPDYNEQPFLFRSFRKYGINNHTFEIIEECPVNHLNYYEIYYIWIHESYNSPHGMNLTTGGDGISGLKKSEESKNKIRGDKNPFYGKKHTPETVEKIREYSTGRKHTDETRKKMSENHIGINLGKKHTEESKEYMSKKAKERWSNTEERKKMSEIKKMNDTSGEKNPNYGGRIIILNKETGIFYQGIRSVAELIGISEDLMGKKINNLIKNNTSFIRV